MSAPVAIAHRRVQAGGIGWHVATAGAGPPLLLLHGWPEFWAVWEPQMARLAAGFTLYAPDLPGFGETPDPAGGPSAALDGAALAQAVLALMDALALPRVGVVAHDIGAYVAQAMALAAPERLAGLFLFDCPTAWIGERWRAPTQIPEIWYQSFNQLPWAAELIGSSPAACRLYIGGMLRHWAHRPEAFSEADLDRWVAAYLRPGNLQGGFNWYRAANAARMAAMAGQAKLPPKITVPAYSFWGRHDPILKAEWADLLPQAFTRIEVALAEAGHFPHWEIPDEAAARITRFFAAHG